MKTIKFMVYSRRVQAKTTGKSFVKRFTTYEFLNDDGTRTRKGIDVKFTQKAFNNTKLNEKDITRGVLEVRADALGCPDKYEITQDKNGKNIYPAVWVRDGGVVSFEERKVEHEFHFTPVDGNELDTEEVSLSVED